MTICPTVKFGDHEYVRDTRDANGRFWVVLEGMCDPVLRLRLGCGDGQTELNLGNDEPVRLF
jgi:hypothetical protein